MLADPLTLFSTAPTAWTNASTSGAGSAYDSYACIGRGPNSSTYRHQISDSHFVDVLISHAYAKRKRTTVRLTETELVQDPVNDNLNSTKVSIVYVVADIGVLGVGTNWTKMMHSLAYLLMKASDSPAIFDRIVAGET